MSSQAATAIAHRLSIVAAVSDDRLAFRMAGSSATFEREGQFWKAECNESLGRSSMMVTLQRYTDASYQEKIGPWRAYTFTARSLIEAVVEDYFSGELARLPENGS